VESVWATHSSIYYICICYHQNHTFYKDGINKFPLFDNDKPNDHFDIKRKNECQCQTSQTKEEKKFGQSNSSQVNQNNHGHVYLRPFDIIEKGLGRANKINQGVCNTG